GQCYVEKASDVPAVLPLIAQRPVRSGGGDFETVLSGKHICTLKHFAYTFAYRAALIKRNTAFGIYIHFEKTLLKAAPHYHIYKVRIVRPADVVQSLHNMFGQNCRHSCCKQPIIY